MQFNADVADGMPWKFIPTQREVILFVDAYIKHTHTDVLILTRLLTGVVASFIWCLYFLEHPLHETKPRTAQAQH